MAPETSLPKTLLAKREKELAQVGKTGRINLQDVFRMVYENVAENELVKEFAPEEIENLKNSIDEVLKNLDTIAEKVSKKSGKGPKDQDRKRRAPSKREPAKKQSSPTTRRRSKK